MKLNKTLMIAALVAGGVFAAQLAVYAQDATNTPPAAPPTAPPPGARPPGGPGARPQVNFERVATQLSLSDDQKPKVKAVLDERLQKVADLRKDTTTAPVDKRAKFKEITDDANAKLKEILTPEQFEKWQKMMPSRRPPGGPGAPPPTAPPVAPAPDAKPPQ
jgi:Spy/CpxP family protein refolding chaperone